MRRERCIRPARANDVADLVRIEVAAGDLFREIGMVDVAAHKPDADDLRERVLAHRCWVVSVDGVAVAYATAEILDGNAHIAQVSVDPKHAGQRHGSRLVATVEQWGRTLHCPATTLTTFTHVPWNGPYYRRLGYEVLAPELIGSELRRVMEHEASLPGIDAEARCAMVRHNVGTDASQVRAG